MQNKHKVDKESGQNSFDMPACLPTEIESQTSDVSFSLYGPPSHQVTVSFSNLKATVAWTQVINGTIEDHGAAKQNTQEMGTTAQLETDPQVFLGPNKPKGTTDPPLFMSYICI